MAKMRILAVDDNVVNLATIEKELKDKYEVIPLSSGRRAVKFILQERVDLILLDIQMPVMDGIETLREIRNHENGITVPVIVLSAKHDRETVIEGTKLGIMDYVLKPFNGDDLRNRIEGALKRRGALPMGDDELYQRIKETIQYIKDDNLKSAVIKTEEMLGYQLDEEVSARIKAAKTKMKLGEIEVAERMYERVLQMLNQKNDAIEDEELLPISLGELNAKLLFILDDIAHFRTDDALERFEDLFKYAIPAKIKNKCVKAHNCLKEYDDGEAEKLIQETLKEL